MIWNYWIEESLFLSWGLSPKSERNCAAEGNSKLRFSWVSGAGIIMPPEEKGQHGNPLRCSFLKPWTNLQQCLRLLKAKGCFKIILPLFWTSNLTFETHWKHSQDHSLQSHNHHVEYHYLTSNCNRFLNRDRSTKHPSHHVAGRASREKAFKIIVVKLNGLQ